MKRIAIFGLVALICVVLAGLGSSNVLAQATPMPTPIPGCGTLTVTEQAGWNLVGAPQGTVLTGAAALFTLPPGATSYQSLGPSTPLTAPQGYWAFYFSPTTVTLPCVPFTLTFPPLALNAGQVELVGDSYDTPAGVSASGVPTYAITFNTATNSWSGWTRIDSGSTLTIPEGGAAFVATTASGGSTAGIGGLFSP